MKYSVKIIAALCAVLMLCGCFAACVDTGDGGDTTTASLVDDGSKGPEESTDKDGYLIDDLPDGLNYNATVSVLYWDDAERTEFEVLEDSLDGDIVEEAIYNRNIATEEKLGVTFDWIGQKGNSSNRATFTTHVQTQYSGGTYYDIIATYSRTAGMLCLRGLLEDINAIENSYIDLEMPWWPETMTDTCEIDDSLYFVSGDISTNVLHFMYAVYYNIDMLNDLQLEDPIPLVDDKTWTLDKMIEMTNDTYVDKDGDNKASDGDQFGFGSTYYHLDAFYTGSNLMLVEEDPEKTLIISPDFYSDKSIALVDKLSNWFRQGHSYVNPHCEDIAYGRPFLNGTMLFCLNRVYMADPYYSNGELREATWEYGVLPVPLYDTNQENYVTVVGNPFTLWCVMKDAENPSMSTAVLECLASQGYRKTTPALFETNMKYRYTPDSADKGDSARMFDIVRGTIAFDLGRIFSDELSFMSEMPSKAAAAMGSWATQGKTQNAVLEKTIPRMVNDLLEKNAD